MSKKFSRFLRQIIYSNSPISATFTTIPQQAAPLIPLFIPHTQTIHTTTGGSWPQSSRAWSSKVSLPCSNSNDLSILLKLKGKQTNKNTKLLSPQDLRARPPSPVPRPQLL